MKVIDLAEKQLNNEILPNEFIQQIDKCITHQDIKCIAHKVNEVINYLQHINKEDLKYEIYELVKK